MWLQELTGNANCGPLLGTSLALCEMFYFLVCEQGGPSAFCFIYLQPSVWRTRFPSGNETRFR